MTSIFPLGSLIEQEVSAQEAAEEIYKKEYAFDFEKGEFIQTSTKKPRLDDGIAAYKTWAQKTLLTPRYKHLAYGRAYGQEFEDLVRRNLTRAANESEIKRMITEALMVDPRTREITDFAFSWADDEVVCEFAVTTTRGDRAQLSVSVRS